MKGISFKDNLRNRKHNKLSYYSKAYINRYLNLGSDYFLKQLLSKEPSTKELDRLIERRDYYCSDKAIGKGKVAIKEIKNFQKPKNYYIDLYKVLKYFPKDLMVNHLFGDIDYAPDEASFVKSRPILNAEQSILLKLNHIRHFYFVEDPIPFDQKKDHLMWRGAIWKRQKQRQSFFDIHGGNKYFDIGLVKGMEEYFPKYRKDFLTVAEQLNNKFILSIEGNDVATNLKWIMSSNSIPVMPKPTCETWFMEGTLKADEHYVEIAQDFSDLEEKLDFAKNNSEWVQGMIKRNQEYVKEFKDDRKELILELLVADKAIQVFGYPSYLSKAFPWMSI